MTIYVGNLSFDAEAEDVQNLFAEYGDVRKCSLPLDRDTGRKRGFAFIEMADEASEQKAIDDLQNVEWMGRAIRVNKAEPRTGGGNRQPAGAFGGGGGYNGGGYGGGKRW
jgi:RNA recognition motif-containing protein